MLPLVLTHSHISKKQPPCCLPPSPPPPRVFGKAQTAGRRQPPAAPNAVYPRSPPIRRPQVESGGICVYLSGSGFKGKPKGNPFGGVADLKTPIRTGLPVKERRIDPNSPSSSSASSKEKPFGGPFKPNRLDGFDLLNHLSHKSSRTHFEASHGP